MILRSDTSHPGPENSLLGGTYRLDRGRLPLDGSGHRFLGTILPDGMYHLFRETVLAEPASDKAADRAAPEILLANTSDGEVPSNGELVTSWLPSKDL